MAMDEHRGIIIEALQDYRRWWDDSNDFWKEKVNEIDAVLAAA